MSPISLLQQRSGGKKSTDMIRIKWNKDSKMTGHPRAFPKHTQHYILHLWVLILNASHLMHHETLHSKMYIPVTTCMQQDLSIRLVSVFPCLYDSVLVVCTEPKHSPRFLLESSKLHVILVFVLLYSTSCVMTWQFVRP